MAKHKPYTACLDDEQMANCRKRFLKEKECFWDKTEIVVIHTNDFYRTFLKFKGRDDYFELKVIPKSEVEHYEILGETVYRTA